MLWDFMYVASNISRRYNLSKFPVPLALTIFHPFFLNDYWALNPRIMLQMYPLELDSIALHILIGCGFPLMVPDFYKEKYLWWWLKTALICGDNDKYLECISGLCCFSKVVVVGSPPRSMTSLALGSWLAFMSQAWVPSCWTGLKSN